MAARGRRDGDTDPHGRGAGATGHEPAPAPAGAAPANAVAASARALDERPVVAVGEHPVWEQERAFLLALVRDATLAKTEVLDRGRRALLVLGTAHVLRGSESGGRLTVVQRLEAAVPRSTFVVVPFDGFGDPAPVRALDARLAGWPVPSLAPLRGTPLRATDASTLSRSTCTAW